METMTLEEFVGRTAGGKIFTITFIKRTNGETRMMNCRRGVRKGVKGVGLKFKPEEKKLLVVYDMQKIETEGERGAFRMVNLETLIELKLDGKIWKWDCDGQKFMCTN